MYESAKCTNMDDRSNVIEHACGFQINMFMHQRNMYRYAHDCIVDDDSLCSSYGKRNNPLFRSYNARHIPSYSSNICDNWESSFAFDISPSVFIIVVGLIIDVIFVFIRIAVSFAR